MANVKTWFPLHAHSHASLLDGLTKPAQFVDRCKKLNLPGCAITDHGTVSGVVSFSKPMQKAGLKPILGCEFYLCPQAPDIKDSSNRSLSHLVVLAKNKKGWEQLIAATSESNKKEFVYYDKPRLDLDTLGKFADGNILCFSGHLGSDMANVIFDEPKLAYQAKTYEQATKLVSKDWLAKARNLASRYVEIFGKENFKLEIQLIDVKNLPAQLVVTKALRYIAKQLGLDCVATADSHYASQEDAADQRILLCSALGVTLKTVRNRMEAEEDVSLGGFFKSNNYHIPSYEEMIECGCTEEELDASLEIASQCEEYSLLGQPMLPQFDCPEGRNPDQHLTELCRDGWKRLLKLSKKEEGVYRDRIKYELKVIQEAGLSSYFLIVQDYNRWTREQGWLTGPGRGSGAGCLVSYLIGITQVDPIPYGLMFERFYNAGRNSPGRISLPDIDCDFPIGKRDQVIEYIRTKYGRDRVSQMVTFSRMQGRGALKDVLRAHEACSFDEMQRITEHVPDPAAISDQLQVMLEETGEASIIRWALENNAAALKEYCYIDDNGKLQGQYAAMFAQAIRLEGTKRSQGKHAAGIVISAFPLAQVCPMVNDKSSDEMIAGMEMGDLEAMGHVKFDILGVASLDKIMGVKQILRTGRING